MFGALKNNNDPDVFIPRLLLHPLQFLALKNNRIPQCVEIIKNVSFQFSAKIQHFRRFDNIFMSMNASVHKWSLSTDIFTIEINVLISFQTLWNLDCWRFKDSSHTEPKCEDFFIYFQKVPNLDFV